MVRLREIPRTAAFAWSPGPELPLVVTGTRAGAVDAEFSDETKLELWDLNLDKLEQGVELQPIASLSTDSRFHDMAWGQANPDHPRGIVAGALENGSLDLWDAAKLIHGASDAFMFRSIKHTGAIKSLQFNPLKPQILATAGIKGELYIYDVNDVSNPFRLGTAAARSDDLECVAWNRKVAHILATGGSGGFVTVWDLKTKKASLTLNNNRRAVAAIEWDPNNPTKLLTASPDDSSPAILLWDLRNSNAPERTLLGHDQGILSLSWCQQDSDLLLSCGKDNRTLCWNPQTGERLGEFPEVTNWTFQTRFGPHNPNLSATASFDGKIAIQTLQNTSSSPNQTAVQGPTDGEDFFTKAQTQPQGAFFSLPKAPKWLERPVGVSFGFGGKLVTFRLQTSRDQTRSSAVHITKFVVDSDVGVATESFERALLARDIGSICETHILQAKTEEEKADWKVIETFIEHNPRERVIEFLGFSEIEDYSNSGNKPEELARNGNQKLSDKSNNKLQENGQANSKPSRLSTFFADGAENDDFLSNLAATKGAKTDNPFELYSGSDSSSDRQITKALMLGQFEKAMAICLNEDRMADAFMIANCGGKDLVDRAQAAYLSKKSQGPNYLRLLASVIGENLWDIVYNADLANWKESMVTLCTYADPNEFSDLCEALGDRVLESGSRKDASFCYLVGSKLEKVTGIWISELKESEQVSMRESSEDSTFSIHARSLQNFIEKVTVFRDVTKFQDKEQSERSGWKMTPLYDRYIEYADIIAAHGQLSIAEKYLSLLPSQYPAADTARDRVSKATKATSPQAKTRDQQPSTARIAPRTQPGFQPQQALPVTQNSNIGSHYVNPGPVLSTNPFTPSITTAYTPQQGYIPPQGQAFGHSAIANPMGYVQGNQHSSFGGPPKNINPSIPPPSQSKDMSNWNDTPMVTKPAISRRGTPGMTPAPMPSSFPNQQNLVMPPSAPPFSAARGSPTPPPPPPKGPAPPRMTSPLSAAGPSPTVQQSTRPPSASVSNYYTPTPTQKGQQFVQAAPPSIPRGPSPYNPPPSGAPPSSRYAPAPIAQQYTQPSAPQANTGPPPQIGNRPPPPNRYTPQQPTQSQHNTNPIISSPYQPLHTPQQALHGQGPIQQSPPSQPPLISSRPGTGQPQANQTPAPNTPKHPPGDRSHIPVSSQQMVSIFNTDMQRVAGKAPPSFAAQVKDTQKRLNILFDHLNNEDLLKPDTIGRLDALSQALKARDYDTAARMQVDIQREKLDECGNWMVGVKRLIAMSKVTP